MYLNKTYKISFYKKWYCDIILQRGRCSESLNKPLEWNTTGTERFCTLCNSGQFGDEFHFILECKSLENLRKKLPVQILLPKS